MKIPVLILGLFIGTLYASETLYSLTVTIKNLKNDHGEVQIALYNKEGTIPDKEQNQYFLKKRVQPKNQEVEVTFSHLPKGRYAVSVYHDENNNHKIDKGLFLPEEGVGLSRLDTINFLHLPSFETASFELNHDTIVPITLHYF